MFSQILAVIYLLAALVSAQIGVQTGNWGIQRDGSYRNPIIAGDYSDPDMIYENGTVYMITSTFWFSPGIAILKSTDLINWETHGTVIPNTTLAFNSTSFSWSGMNQWNAGISAPSIRLHNGTYYIFYNAYEIGFFVSTALSIDGPWETKPLLDLAGRPLLTGPLWDDPCPIWTDDGKAYLVTSKTGGAWYPHLFQMSPDGKQLLDGSLTTMSKSGLFPTDGTVIWNVSSSEGNKYYFWNGYHYFWRTQLFPHSRYRSGYLMRSKNIYGTLANGEPGSPGNAGTYEQKLVINPGAPSRARDPTQGTIFQLDCGEWWFVTQGGISGPEGRPLSLVPVTWNNTDGFPILGVNPINGGGQFDWNGGATPCNVSSDIASQKFPQGSDNFSSPILHPRWSWSYQPRPGFWSLTDVPGSMRLKAFKQLIVSDFSTTGNMLFQRFFRSNSIQVTVQISFASFATGQVGGLAHWADNFSYSFLGISMSASGNPEIIFSQNSTSNTITSNTTIPVPSLAGTTVYVRSVADYGCNQEFSYSFDGKTFTGLGQNYTLTNYEYRGDMIVLFTYNNAQEAGAMDITNFEYCFDHGWGLQC